MTVIHFKMGILSLAALVLSIASTFCFVAVQAQDCAPPNPGFGAVCENGTYWITTNVSVAPNQTFYALAPVSVQGTLTLTYEATLVLSLGARVDVEKDAVLYGDLHVAISQKQQAVIGNGTEFAWTAIQAANLVGILRNFSSVLQNGTVMRDLAVCRDFMLAVRYSPNQLNISAAAACQPPSGRAPGAPPAAPRDVAPIPPVPAGVPSNAPAPAPKGPIAPATFVVITSPQSPDTWSVPKVSAIAAITILVLAGIVASVVLLILKRRQKQRGRFQSDASFSSSPSPSSSFQSNPRKFINPTDAILADDTTGDDEAPSSTSSNISRNSSLSWSKSRLLLGRRYINLPDLVWTSPRARGGLMTVWGGVWRATNVSLKVIRADSQRIVDAVLDRMRIITGLGGHPHIITVHGITFLPSGTDCPFSGPIVPTALIGVNHDRFVVVMELMDESLADLMAKSGDSGLPVERLLPIVKAAASGLHHLHAEKVLHRNLHPGNVLVTRNATEIKLSDIDLFDDVVQPNDIRWCAPEGIKTEASDIYSFGLLIFAGLTGRVAFDGLTDKQLRNPVDRELWLANATTQDRWRTSKDVKWLVDLALKCCVSQPDRRPSSEDISKLAWPATEAEKAAAEQLSGSI